MPKRYSIPAERVVLGEAEIEPNEPKRARARQHCAATGGTFQYLTMDMCAKTRGSGPEYVIENSRSVAHFVQKYLGDQINVREYFGSLLLDNKNKVVAFAIVAQGGMAEVSIELPMVFKPALVMPTRAMIVVHNHPSGDSKPSPVDIAFTKRILDASKLLGMPVLDHIIVSRNGYFSFLDAGMMPTAR